MRTHFFAAIALLAMAVLSAEAWAVDVKVRGAGPSPWENITFPVVHHLVAYGDEPPPAADPAGGEKPTLPKGNPSPVYVGYVVIYADGFFHAKFVGLETRKDIQALFEPYEEPLRLSYYLCGFGAHGLMDGRWERIQHAVSQLDDMRVKIFYTTDGVWPFLDWGPVFIQYCREHILQFLRNSLR